MKQSKGFLSVGNFGFVSVVITLLACYSASAKADIWQWLNPTPTGNLLNGVSFLNGQFVTCAESQLFTSQDGTNWTAYAIQQNDVSLSRVGYGAGLYVAVGYRAGGGAIVVSSNLTDWVLQAVETTNRLQAVVYGNGLFVVSGDRGIILTSTNGITWETRVSGTVNSLKSIAFGNGTYVALSGDSGASVSSDGITWTRISVGLEELTSINYAKGLFHAGGLRRFGPQQMVSGALYVSSDGTNWSGDLSVSGYPIRSIFADTNNFYLEVGVDLPALVGTIGLLKSSNGTNFSAFTATNLGPANPPNGYAYGQSVFVGAGRAILVSPNATNWNRITGSTDVLSDIAYGNNAYVAVGSGLGGVGLGNGVILRSVNGARFEAQTSPVTAHLSRVLFTNGVFHAVGMSGTILRSTNGAQWFQRTSGTGNHLWSLCSGNGLLMAVGNNGTIITSPNGLVWTLRSSGTGSALNGVASAPNLFVAVGAGGTIVTSPDGSNWTGQFADTIDTFFDVTYGGGLFVAVGANGAVWNSLDGVNWNAGSSGTTSRLLAVTFNDGRFIAAGSPDDFGNQNVLLMSTDGSTWAALDPGTSYRLYGARFINHAFVVAGANGAILQSASSVTMLLGGKWNSTTGQYELLIDGGLGQSFVVQSKDSLSAQWNSRLFVTNAPKPLIFSDPTSALQTSGFYRTVGQ